MPPHKIYMHQPTHMKNGEKILIYEIDAMGWICLLEPHVLDIWSLNPYVGFWRPEWVGLWGVVKWCCKVRVTMAALMALWEETRADTLTLSHVSPPCSHADRKLPPDTRTTLLVFPASRTINPKGVYSIHYPDFWYSAMPTEHKLKIRNVSDIEW